VLRQLRTGLFALAGLAVATAASAAGWTARAHYGVEVVPVGAPEIGPQAAVGALTLLSGALLVLRGRRSKP
jgi:hypothetical protein